MELEDAVVGRLLIRKQTFVPFDNPLDHMLNAFRNAHRNIVPVFGPFVPQGMLFGEVAARLGDFDLVRVERHGDGGGGLHRRLGVVEEAEDYRLIP